MSRVGNRLRWGGQVVDESSQRAIVDLAMEALGNDSSLVVEPSGALIRELAAQYLLREPPSPSPRLDAVYGLIPFAPLYLDEIHRPWEPHWREAWSPRHLQWHSASIAQFLFDRSSGGRIITALWHRHLPVELPRGRETDPGLWMYTTIEAFHRFLKTLGNPDLVWESDAQWHVIRSFADELRLGLLLWLVRERHAPEMWATDEYRVIDLIEQNVDDWDLREYMGDPTRGFDVCWETYANARVQRTPTSADVLIGPGLTPVTDLHLPDHTMSLLCHNGIRSIEQLASQSEADLSRFINFGTRSLLAVIEQLAERGLTLADKERADSRE